MIGYLRSLLIVALLSGSAAGLVSWVAHLAGATPLILEAETYEQAGDEPAGAAQSVDGHDHAGADFAPEDGWERNLFTLGADILTGVGFAMMMVAGFVFAGGRIDARRGLLWGLAGFAAFTLAPSLGLPPELPGTEAAPLAARQVWWLLTALATIVGIVALLKVRRPWGWALAALLFAAPHVVGAPQPAEHAATAPEELQRAFVWVAIGSGLLFWLALGCLAGLAFKRLAGDRVVG